jgi:hypothetical protein
MSRPKRDTGPIPIVGEHPSQRHLVEAPAIEPAKPAEPEHAWAVAIAEAGPALGLSKKTIALVAGALTIVLSVLAPLGERLTGSLLGSGQLDRIEASLVEINLRLDQIERAQADTARLAESHEAEIALLRSRAPARLPASLRSVIAADDLVRELEEAKP